MTSLKKYSFQILALFFLIFHLTAVSADSHAVCSSLETCKKLVSDGNICAVKPYLGLVVTKITNEKNEEKKIGNIEMGRILMKDIESSFKLISENDGLCAAQAQQSIGAIYSLLLENKILAKKWIDRAILNYSTLAKADSLEAQYALAEIYSDYGLRPDIENRNFWYEKLLSSDKNTLKACSFSLILAHYYYFNSENQDLEKAIRFYKKSLEESLKKENDCALTYKTIEGFWLGAQIDLASAYYNGTNNNGKIHEKNYEEAFKLYLKIASYYDSLEKNSHDAWPIYRQVAMMYEYGEGTQKNYDQSIIWLEKITKDVDVKDVTIDTLGAMFALGHIYHKLGRFDNAINWYQEAAQYALTYDEANEIIRTRLREFDEGTKDNNLKDSKPYLLIKNKLKNDLVEQFSTARSLTTLAMTNLGYLYEKNLNNYLKAVYWYEKGAKLGNALAQYNLSSMYQRGLGVLKDDRQAYAWINVAIANQLPTEEMEKQAIQMRQTLSFVLANEDTVNKTNFHREAELLSEDYYKKYGSFPNEKNLY